jgi:hypothetical protein
VRKWKLERAPVAQGGIFAQRTIGPARSLYSRPRYIDNPPPPSNWALWALVTPAVRLGARLKGPCYRLSLGGNGNAIFTGPGPELILAGFFQLRPGQENAAICAIWHELACQMALMEVCQIILKVTRKFLGVPKP